MSLIDAKLEQWKLRLLDLSKRNRLLYFRSVRNGNVQIIEPPAEDVFSWLVVDEKKVTFARRASSQPQLQFDEEIGTLFDREAKGRECPLQPGEVRTALSDSQLSATLYNLRSKARTTLEEQGVNTLYLALGMLQWFETESSDEKIRSPLILVPVEMARPSINQPYSIELIDEDIVLNPTLVYRMQDFRVSFPQLPEDWAETSLWQVLAQVGETIKDQPRWSISPEVHLGLFAFEKLVMVKDLEVHAEEIREHPLVLALAGDKSKLPPAPSDLPLAEELDKKVMPEHTFQVLDADSSQQEAIELAKRGVSFVIQGPPGTGKSQTISNIIGECLAQGKKVLFVSEKEAALDVVKERLDQTGLGDFCLKAHSHRGNKRELLAQLEKSLNTSQAPATTSFESDLKHLAELRTWLDKYPDILHRERLPLHRSVFQIHGELANLFDHPNLIFPFEGVSQVDVDQFRKTLTALQNLGAMSEVWENYEIHPWRGTLVQVFSFQNQTDIQSHFSEFIKCLTELEAVSVQLGEVFGLKPPSNWVEVKPFLQSVAHAVDTPFPPTNWLQHPDIVPLTKAAKEAQKVLEDYVASRSKLLAEHTEAILELQDLEGLVSRFENSYRRVPGILRIFNSSYLRDMQTVRDTAHSHKVGFNQALTNLRLALQIRKNKQWIDEASINHQRMFGKYFSGMNTDWQGILAALDWTEKLLSRFSPEPIPDQLLDIVSNQQDMINSAKGLLLSLQDIVERTRAELAYLATIFPIDRMKIDGGRVEEVRFSLLKERIQHRLDHLDDLQKWIEFETARKECEQQKLGPFLSAANAAKIKADELKSSFLKRFYALWLDAVYEQEPALRTFSSDHQVRLIEQFRDMDRKELGIAQRRIAAQLVALQPRANWVDAPSSEVTILRRELLKTRRHKPIRRLFAEIPNLLLALKPCLMMSPLSTSQFLSLADLKFDAVIFDEASQLTPESTITSIMRAKQVIVAGDNQQLPPTPFFKSLGIDFDLSDEEPLDDILESILQEYSGFMPNRMLKWHYRSRHESLIAFSNHHFYDNELITFPNSKLDERELGIEFIYVPDGLYDRGRSRKNRVEAKHVAELVYQHFTQFPVLSLGVVAFSEAQREAIAEELERLASEDHEFFVYINQKGLEAFILQNLENIQGHERDVMIFSIGYGKDAAGKMPMTFGPLNGNGGARRLNVAITRARYHVKLVSSILPDIIDPQYQNQAVQLLRHYMEYARQRGSRSALYAEADVKPLAESESPFEDAVYRALMDCGLIVDKQVGCSGYRIDLGIRDPEHPGRYLLGIECDGATYHSAKTARDRDRLRQQILEGLGWRIHRVWSRDWIMNPRREVQNIQNAVSLAKRLPDQSSSPQTDPPAQTRDTTISEKGDDPANGTVTPQGAITVLAPPKGVVTYSYLELPKQGYAHQFHSGSLNAISRLLLSLVKHEGPIHIKTACRRIAACWGISRVGSNVEGQILFAVKRLVPEGSIELKDGFLWPAGRQEVLVRQPPSGEPPRHIDEIAIEEIAQAAYLCLHDAFSLTEQDLQIQTARLLGIERTSERIRRRIQVAIDRLFEEQRATIANGKIELTN